MSNIFFLFFCGWFVSGTVNLMTTRLLFPRQMAGTHQKTHRHPATIIFQKLRKMSYTNLGSYSIICSCISVKSILLTHIYKFNLAYIDSITSIFLCTIGSIKKKWISYRNFVYFWKIISRVSYVKKYLATYQLWRENVFTFEN